MQFIWIAAEPHKIGPQLNKRHMLSHSSMTLFILKSCGISPPLIPHMHQYYRIKEHIHFFSEDKKDKFPKLDLKAKKGGITMHNLMYHIFTGNLSNY